MKEHEVQRKLTKEVIFRLYVLLISLFICIGGMYIIAVNPDSQAKQTMIWVLWVLSGLSFVIAFTCWSLLPETATKNVSEKGEIKNE